MNMKLPFTNEHETDTCILAHHINRQTFSINDCNSYMNYWMHGTEQTLECRQLGIWYALICYFDIGWPYLVIQLIFLLMLLLSMALCYPSVRGHLRSAFMAFKASMMHQWHGISLHLFDSKNPLAFSLYGRTHRTWFGWLHCYSMLWLYFLETWLRMWLKSFLIKGHDLPISNCNSVAANDIVTEGLRQQQSGYKGVGLTCHCLLWRMILF